MKLTDLVQKIGGNLNNDDIAAFVTKLKEGGYFVENLPKTSGVDLLSAMTSQQMITTSDLSLLERILYVLERKELIEYLREFKTQQEHGVPEERTEGNVIKTMFTIPAKKSKDSEEFRVFMRKFCETMEQDDINTIRKKLKDEYDLSNITSREELLQKLLFNHSNLQSPLELLQKVVFLLGKKKLLELLIEFKDQTGSTTLRSVDYEESFDEPLFPVKLQLKYVQPSDEQLKILLKHLCELLALPYEEIILDQTRHEEGSTVSVMVKEMYKDVLESMLEKDPLKTGLNFYGVCTVHIGIKAPYQISETMIPIAKLLEYRKTAAAFEEYMKKADADLKELEEKAKLLDKMKAELGDPEWHLQQLGRLHKSAGLSTTVWKTVGKLSAEEELPQKYTPFMMQDQLRQECLYSKARMMRLYPEQTWKTFSQTAANAI